MSGLRSPELVATEHEKIELERERQHENIEIERERQRGQLEIEKSRTEQINFNLSSLKSNRNAAMYVHSNIMYDGNVCIL